MGILLEAFAVQSIVKVHKLQDVDVQSPLSVSYWVLLYQSQRQRREKLHF
jgi:hypothetical protein